MASAKQQRKVGRVMHEFKHGELDSSSGKKVKSRKQAIAIAMSESGQSRKSKGGGSRSKSGTSRSKSGSSRSKSSSSRSKSKRAS
jgi:hypothetical protein